MGRDCIGRRLSQNLSRVSTLLYGVANGRQAGNFTLCPNEEIVLVVGTELEEAGDVWGFIHDVCLWAFGLGFFSFLID